MIDMNNFFIRILEISSSIVLQNIIAEKNLHVFYINFNYRNIFQP